MKLLHWFGNIIFIMYIISQCRIEVCELSYLLVKGSVVFSGSCRYSVGVTNFNVVTSSKGGEDRLFVNHSVSVCSVVMESVENGASMSTGVADTDSNCVVSDVIKGSFVSTPSDVSDAVVGTISEVVAIEIVSV